MSIQTLQKKMQDANYDESLSRYRATFPYKTTSLAWPDVRAGKGTTPERERVGTRRHSDDVFTCSIYDVV